MSNSSTLPAVTAKFAQQTESSQSSQVPTPPLLPAFLITGLLLGTIVSIIVWRHIMERRHGRREVSDPTWPIENVVSSVSPKGPTPKIWDLEVTNKRERARWEDIMPLSATALHAPPKPRRPRYLVPSDRPVTLFSRMFGGERRPPQPQLPPIAVLDPTQALRFNVARPNDEDEEEEPIDRLQVAVLISLPHPRRGRHSTLLSEKAQESTDTRSRPGAGGLPSIRESPETEDGSFPGKGKKRSLETTIGSHGSDLKTDCDDDEDGLPEVALGLVVLPFSGEG